jgi:hypothetical protein
VSYLPDWVADWAAISSITGVTVPCLIGFIAGSIPEAGRRRNMQDRVRDKDRQQHGRLPPVSLREEARDGLFKVIVRPEIPISSQLFKALFVGIFLLGLIYNYYSLAYSNQGAAGPLAPIFKWF